MPTPAPIPASASYVILALGSNIGNRLKALRSAVMALQAVLKIHKASAIYETAPAYVTAQPSFLNAAISGFTSLSPTDLIAAVKQIELALGREETFRYGPRAIDIDIIFYDNLVLKTEDLTLPHPLLEEREFVLRPMADIAAEFIHPLTGKTIQELLAALPQHTATKTKDLLWQN